MSFHSVQGENPIDALNKLQNSTLVLPLVTIGNIPQLAVDLLIHNYDLKLVGRLDDTYVYPFISPQDYVGDERKAGFSTALEVYHSETLKLTVLQQRSPILPGFTKVFYEELIIPFVATAEFSAVYLLNSSDLSLSDERWFQVFFNEDPISTKLQQLDLAEPSLKVDFVSNPSEISKTCADIITGIQSIQSENESRQTEADLSKDLAAYLKSNFPHSLPLSRTSSSVHFAKAKVMPVGVLSMSAYEGDNSQEAENFALLLLKLLNISKEDSLQRKPRSWLGLYGDRKIPVGLEAGLYS